MLDLIANNFSMHAWKIPSQVEGMDVVHNDHITYVDSHLSCDTFNIIYIKSGATTTKEIQEVIEHFQFNKRDYCIWIAKENLSLSVKSSLETLGINCQASEEGMILDLDKYQIVEHQNHSNIEEVEKEDGLKEYAEVIAANWTPPDHNVITYYHQSSSSYLNPENRIVLLTYYHEGVPASTVEMFPTDENTIGLYGFTTLEAFRGKGIGTTLMTYCLNKAKELGYKQVILQGTEDGLGIYQKHGFEVFTTYYEYS